MTSSGLEIKWCKGCKNFRPWAAFGDKGLATKCVRCRERQREKYALTKEEKDNFFIYLQRALDKKLLNTLKVVQYSQETQRITAIKGLEVGRQSNGAMRWAFMTKKPRGAEVGTRKKKKDENTCENMQKIDEEYA